MTASPLAEDLVLLAVVPQRHRLCAPALDELLAAADVADDVLAGVPLPDDPCEAIRHRAGASHGRRSDRTVHALIARGRLRMERRCRFGVPVQHVDLLDVGARASLVGALDAGLRRPSALPLRLGVLAALASAGGIAADALTVPAREAAEDVAAGVVQLVADRDAVVPGLADGLRRVVDALG